MVFLPQQREDRYHCGSVIETTVIDKRLELLGWRDVPVDAEHVGIQAAERMPVIRQIFVGKGDGGMDQEAFERHLYVTRKTIRNALQDEKQFMIISMSSRVIVYKGMLRPFQMDRFFTDLADSRTVSALMLVHTRFPTNTFPPLGPCPAISLPGTQRRDQYPSRQHQLDESQKTDLRITFV